MTVLVGILCDDGVVIGADSAETMMHGVNFTTVEHAQAIKIRIIGNAAVATTGAVRLAQRFAEHMKALHGQSKLSMSKVMEQATVISESMIAEMRRTMSMWQHQPQNGWGLGALVALPLCNRAELFEFDPVQFHPERKGDPDETGKDRTSRIVSMGSGQVMADPFLGFIRRVFWENERQKDAKLAVAWTLKQVIRLNTGGIGGEPQMASLEKVAGHWRANHVEPGEIMGQVEALEQHIGKYREMLLAMIAEPAASTPRKASPAPSSATSTG